MSDRPWKQIPESPKFKSGTTHPTYRCERCNYWLPRNGGPPPTCPECAMWIPRTNGHGDSNGVSHRMQESFRLAP